MYLEKGDAEVMLILRTVERVVFSEGWYSETEVRQTQREWHAMKDCK